MNNELIKLVDEKIDFRIISYLIISIISTLIMLLSPGTRYRSSIENVWFNELNIFEKVIGDIYYVNMEFDLEKIVLQEEEVSDVMIASYEEILNMIKSDEFFKSHGNVFMDIINDKYCKKNIKML